MTTTSVATAKRNCRHAPRHLKDLLLPLAPRAPYWDSSWLLEGAPAGALAALTATNSTVNLHNYGVLPSEFDAGGRLENATDVRSRGGFISRSGGRACA